MVEKSKNENAPGQNKEFTDEMKEVEQHNCTLIIGYIFVNTNAENASPAHIDLTIFV